MTGASGLIGSAVANEFEMQGNVVVRLDKDKVDVSNWKSVRKASTKIIKEYKKVDILINCAGIKSNFGFSHVEEIINVNYIGSVYMIKTLVPFIPKGGSIVNIGSMEGLVPNEKQIAYSASKFALTGFTLALRKILKNDINVSLVCPSAVGVNDLPVSRVVEMVLTSVNLKQTIVFPSVFKRLRYYLYILTGV